MNGDNEDDLKYDGSRTRVSELRPNTNADLLVRVCAQGPVREVRKGSRPLKVCTFIVGDETGTVELSTFQYDIKNFEKLVGKVVFLKDFWVKEWQDKLQISKGRGGRFMVVEGNDEIPLTSEIMADYGKDEDDDD